MKSIEEMTEQEIFTERNRMRKEIEDCRKMIEKNSSDPHSTAILKDMFGEMWIAYKQFLKDITKDNEIFPQKEYK